MKNSFKAFTLIELAMVLIIISLLFVGSFEAGKHFMIQNNIKATIVKLNAIQNALDIFVIENGKLPCPVGLKLTAGKAPDSCSSANATNGTYITSSNIISGAVPFETLNLTSDMSHDSWNGKIIYSVSTDATKDIKKLTDKDYIIIYDNDLTNKITTKALYSLASNGKNKLGAFDFKTNKQLSSSGISSYENKNIATQNTNENVYFNNYKKYDDIIKYKTKMQILNDTNLSDLPCAISNSIISNLITSTGITDNPIFTLPGLYLGYNEEIENSNKTYKLKCFKYGRLGIFKYAK